MNNRMILALMFTMAVILGAAMMVGNWERIERREAEIGKKCNDAGKVARRIDGILQCVGEPDAGGAQP